MPVRLDSEGALAMLNRTIQAFAQGHISARRAAVLLYGIQMSLGQVPQTPILENISPAHLPGCPAAPASFPSC
jgi:hypothetical protein